ncbi:hypothetical protein Godav_015485 [Gossypium davidsonii]|uniref:Uncharacterized protein n=1 Tax=Gossypium davidsonii TaxID=34287 RepID=A0A7J8RNC2_GOSDV|nr:hypothetical protein [Gossypium davidsonii]
MLTLLQRRLSREEKAFTWRRETQKWSITRWRGSG